MGGPIKNIKTLLERPIRIIKNLYQQPMENYKTFLVIAEFVLIHKSHHITMIIKAGIVLTIATVHHQQPYQEGGGVDLSQL